MNVVFLGTPRAAVPFLEALHDAGHRVLRVITQPDRPVGRSRTPVASPAKTRALELGLEVVQPARIRRAAFAEDLASLQADALVVVAYGRILPGAVLTAARLGAINVHFSLLPAYRGAAPVQWALANNEAVTGVSTMQLDEGMDTGDVLLQRRISIRDDEHAPALFERLADTGRELMLATLDGLDRGAVRAVPQDHAAATYAPLLSRSDGHVDPETAADAIAGRIRGFDPWPGVWLALGSRRVRLVRARRIGDGDRSVAPGTVGTPEGERLPVTCGEGTRLGIESVQFEGKRVMDVRDAINGRQLGPGDVLARL